MKTKIFFLFFFAELFMSVSLSLAAEEVWLWPIEGQNTGEGILYRPQDNIEKEFNFGSLFIGAPEGIRVLCPADAVVTSYNYTYNMSLTNSTTWGGSDQGYDALVAEQKDYFRSKG